MVGAGFVPKQGKCGKAGAALRMELSATWCETVPQVRVVKLATPPPAGRGASRARGCELLLGAAETTTTTRVRYDVFDTHSSQARAELVSQPRKRSLHRKDPRVASPSHPHPSPEISELAKTAPWRKVHGPEWWDGVAIAPERPGQLEEASCAVCCLQGLIPTVVLLWP